MKNFRINNMDALNWIERRFTHASEVIAFIEEKELQTYEIEWESPLYKNQYTTLIKVENGVKTFEIDSLKLPTIFKKIK